MRQEWRPPYDPLHRSPCRTWVVVAGWHFNPALSAVSGRARRFPERCPGELADIGRDSGAIARTIRSGPAVAGALLAVDQICCKGRIRLLICLQHACVNTALAACAQYVVVEHSGPADFVAACGPARRSGSGMEESLGGQAFFRRKFSVARAPRRTPCSAG